VTLEVLGEHVTVAPRDGLADEAVNGVEVDWTTFPDYFARLQKHGSASNVISHVGYEQIRQVVAGRTLEPATPAQLQEMKALMARSMREGAWGMVLALEQQRGGPRHPQEIIELAKIVRYYGGNVSAHIGTEGFKQDKELDFVFRLARETRVPIHLFHFKVRGSQNWSRMAHYIDRIEAARADGVDVTVDQYPYTAMFHSWSALFPAWTRTGGPGRLAELLADPNVRSRVRADEDFVEIFKEHGDAEGVIYARSSYSPHKQYEGMSLARIAALRGETDPIAALMQLMIEAKGQIDGVFHAMSEKNVVMVMKQPWAAVSSDGSAQNLTVPGFPHPRSYGSNARVLGRYVRELKELRLEDAVRKMTSLPAQILRLRDRGILRQGYWADVVVFDPKTIIDTATYEKPKSYAVGVSYVLVNGKTVIKHGDHTGARPGVPVLGPGYQPPSEAAMPER
jgi:N-acyl-D-aspartate/D-glutamate deacylase